MCELEALVAEGESAATAADDGGVALERRRTKIKALSTNFYTTIPHVFPEGAPPAYIDNASELRLKSDLIASLEQMQDAHEISAQADDQSSEPKADQNYKSMNATLKPVEKGTEVWNMIETYVQNGHGLTQSTYMGNSLSKDTTLTLLEVFEAARHSEAETFTKR